MQTRASCALFVVGSSIGLLSIPACRAADQVAPRTPAVAWSQSSERQAEALQAMIDGKKSLAPVPIFVDGARYESRSSDGRFSVIDPDRIATIQAFTGAEAETRAGPAGRHGVIWITTKEPARR